MGEGEKDTKFNFDIIEIIVILTVITLYYLILKFKIQNILKKSIDFFKNTFGSIGLLS